MILLGRQLLPEKMCLGGLLLEGEDYEYWVALACLSHHTALKQHALIRALQLDASLAVAWGFLGKVFCMIQLMLEINCLSILLMG